MTTSLPIELQILTALLTPAIAIGLGYIAYQQWRTAREKLVLDLFKDRLAVYAKITLAIHKVQGPGRPVDHEPFRLLHEARNEAQFLFGNEVQAYVRQLIEHVANLGLAHAMLEAKRNDGTDDGKDWPKVIYDISIALIAVEKELPQLLSKYLNMNQALPASSGRNVAAWWRSLEAEPRKNGEV